MMRISVCLFCLVICFSTSYGQYEFTIEKIISSTPVKSQDKTGTCWAFASTSFIESELIRMGKESIDLSEMFVVHNIYRNKAENYILRQGKANFSQGSLAHDLLYAIDRFGQIPEKFYSGLHLGEEKHDHTELENGLKGFLNGILQQKPISPHWDDAVNAILDTYLGKADEEFQYKGKVHTPLSFHQSLGIDINDYISLTSFTHHPYYQNFILELPDNYSNGYFYNVPLDTMLQVLDYALINGFSVIWDGDVSEPGFSAHRGLAVLPVHMENVNKVPTEEIDVDKKLRQNWYESLSTTDDHLMHIIGIALDQKGKKYYIVKNSWGKISPYEGILYMSESYMKGKTISLTFHRNGIPPSYRNQIR